MQSATCQTTEFVGTTAAERAELVRLCARLVDDREVAEDLAQEALLEAWRNGEKLRDPRARSQWLAGIARNVCLRWHRARGRERIHLVPPAAAGASGNCASASPLEMLPDSVDIELELERDELARLLDRALALLPPEARDVLVAHFIRESPHAETAARLGVNEGAVKMRLRRGKLALRRVLTSELREDAAAYGLIASAADAWQETRIWCPICGMAHLSGCFDPELGSLHLRCLGCYPRRPDGFNSTTQEPRLFAGVRGVKPAHSRLLKAASEYFVAALETNSARCLHCGQPNRLRRGSPERLEVWRRTPLAMHILCSCCGATVDCSLVGLVLALSPMRRFWQHHPRIRALPIRETTCDGVDALLVGFEVVTTRQCLTVIAARDTFRIIGVHGAPDA